VTEVPFLKRSPYLKNETTFGFSNKCRHLHIEHTALLHHSLSRTSENSTNPEIAITNKAFEMILINYHTFKTMKLSYKRLHKIYQEK
jgi:hypothetical protein